MTNGKYFSVGERVGLVSVYFPEVNGEYVIEHHEYGYFMDSTTGKGGYGHSYTLMGLYELDGELSWWCQSALRKLHKPSTDSFNEMMTKLTDKVGEPTQ